MTQEMIDGALNSKSIMKFDGSNVSVDFRDVQKEADETAAKNNAAKNLIEDAKKSERQHYQTHNTYGSSI